MFSWFTAKSVDRTEEVVRNPFGVYDLTFLEWEQKEVISQKQKVYFCSDKTKKSKTDRNYEVIFKKDRISCYSLFRSSNKEEAENVFKTVEKMLNLLSDGITSNRPLITAPILEEIVQLIRAHSKWTSAHIAAKVGLNSLFIHKTSHILSNLNNQSRPDLSTPLHLSIESGRLSTTKVVLFLKPKLNLKDEFGNCAIHLAAMSEKDIFEEFLKEKNILEMMKWRNKRFCTAIHLACFAHKFENVIRLMEFGLTREMLTITKPKPTFKRADFTKKDQKVDQKVDQKMDQKVDQIIRFQSEDIEDLDTEDMQYGGTPLHWVKHRRALERIIGMNFDVNVKNALGETALHTMVRRMRLKCVIGLLCFGAKVNKRNDLFESPLHLAVKAADVTSSQALIIFDAKIDHKNSNGETPRHIAAQTEQPDHHLVLWLLTAIGAKRCSENMTNCKTGCAFSGTYDGKPYHRWPTYDNQSFYKKVLLEPIIRKALNKKDDDNKQDKPKGVRMLCLDGGGVRGLISIQILLELEERLKVPIFESFEWIAGTSTGSILALLIAKKRKLKEMRRIYFRFKDKILIGSRPYSSENFETLLEEEIGADFKMCEVMTKYDKHLIIFGTLIDRNPAKLHLFRSYESPEEVLGLSETLHGFKAYPNHKEQIAWKACRASGAAPTYFTASGAFLDGGLIANNPTLDGMTEFKLYNNALKAVGRDEDSRELEIVLSLGTGKFEITHNEPIDVVKMWSFNPREIAKNTVYLKQMGNLLINQVTATEGHIIDRAQSWCSGTNTPYFRINPVLSEALPLDETNDIEICNAMWETKAYMYALRHEVESIVKLISPKAKSKAIQKKNISPDLKISVDMNTNTPNVQIMSKNISKIESPLNKVN